MEAEGGSTIQPEQLSDAQLLLEILLRLAEIEECMCAHELEREAA